MTDKQTPVGYKAALKQARYEFDEAKGRLALITEEATFLNDQIAKLRRTITALAAMCSEEPGFDDLGITESVMEFMEPQIFEVSTNEVVEGLEQMGFDLSSQKNASASVHSILSRLSAQGKIQRVKTEKGGIVWRGPKYDPDAIPF